MRVRSRAVIAALAAMAAAVVMTWPLAAGINHLGRTQNSGDARFAVWNVAWVAHALTTSPTTVYDANIFVPHRRTLAYSEANLGAGALASPVWWLTGNPYASHNVVVLLSFAASLICAWLLARRLTGDGTAAATAAVLFAFCPYVFSHTAHIQLLMTAGVPLAMLMLHRVVDRPSIGRAAALGAVLIAQALSCAYYGIFAGIMVGYAALFYAWTRGLYRSPGYWGAIAAAAAVSVAAVLPFFLPYLQIQDETGFARSLDDARAYSATWRSYLASGARPHAWMLPLLRSWNNEVLFPGFVGLVLGAAGVAATWSAGRTNTTSKGAPPRETAALYGSLGLLTLWASLGPQAGLYTLLYHVFPVFSFLRAPGRMGIVVMLSLAIFAAFAVQMLRRWFTSRAAAIGILACAAAAIDLWQAPFPWRPADPLPASYRMLAQLPRGPVVEFPFYDRRIDFHVHTRYMLNSTAHWQPLVNGYSDHIPIDFRTLAKRLASFPSRDSFEAMKERRARYITIHRNLYGYEVAEDVERRLDEFRAHLRLLADDGKMRLYEIVSWPK